MTCVIGFLCSPCTLSHFLPNVKICSFKQFDFLLTDKLLAIDKPYGLASHGRLPEILLIFFS